MLKWDFKNLLGKDEPVETKELKKKKEWENYIWIEDRLLTLFHILSLRGYTSLNLLEKT